MAKNQWKTPIPEDERGEYLKIAKQKFSDKEINKYIADESWLAQKWATKAVESKVGGLGEDFDKFRGYQQQHLNRALELEKIKVERNAAHWTQRLTLFGVFAAIFFGFMDYKNQSNSCSFNRNIEPTQSRRSGF